MKYAWIEDDKLRWPVCVQCRVLCVSASGYRQNLARLFAVDLRVQAARAC